MTGDPTEDGLTREFQDIAAQLKRLKLAKYARAHDYRSTGYLLFKQFFPFSQIMEVGSAVISVVSSARPDRDDGEVGHR